MKCLKEMGVPLIAIDEHGRHLLHHLARYGSLTREVLEFILSNTSMDLESQDNFGKTPRQYAEDKIHLLAPSSTSYDAAVRSLQSVLELVLD